MEFTARRIEDLLCLLFCCCCFLFEMGSYSVQRQIFVWRFCWERRIRSTSKWIKNWNGRIISAKKWKSYRCNLPRIKHIEAIRKQPNPNKWILCWIWCQQNAKYKWCRIIPKYSYNQILFYRKYNYRELPNVDTSRIAYFNHSTSVQIFTKLSLCTWDFVEREENTKAKRLRVDKIHIHCW